MISSVVERFDMLEEDEWTVRNEDRIYSQWLV